MKVLVHTKGPTLSITAPKPLPFSLRRLAMSAAAVPTFTTAAAAAAVPLFAWDNVPLKDNIRMLLEKDLLSIPLRDMEHSVEAANVANQNDAYQQQLRDQFHTTSLAHWVGLNQFAPRTPVTTTTRLAEVVLQQLLHAADHAARSNFWLAAMNQLSDAEWIDMWHHCPVKHLYAVNWIIHLLQNQEQGTVALGHIHAEPHASANHGSLVAAVGSVIDHVLHPVHHVPSM